MKKFNFDNLAKNLPDSFAKNKESNNFKILEIERYSLEQYKEDLQAIFDSLDLNNARGKTLDLYGESVGQPRGVATDEQYIMLIRAKIQRNLSGGDYPSVLKALCATFNCEPEQIYIKETDTPCVVEAVALPLDSLNNANISKNQAIELVRAILPTGITVETAIAEGTFEFSDEIDDIDANAGFGDLEDETVGGYFGEIISEDDEQPLPI